MFKLIIQKNQTGKRLDTMGKTMCEKDKKGEQNTTDPKFKCKKCGAKTKKDTQVCKPKAIE